MIRLVGEGQINPPASDAAEAYYNAFKAKYPDGNIDQPRISNVIGMLAQAITAAGTADDVVAVANALEGMEFDSMWGSKIFMRPNDHQAIQNVHISAHTNEGVTFAYDGSEYGTVVETTIEMAAMDSTSTCEMKRP